MIRVELLGDKAVRARLDRGARELADLTTPTRRATDSVARRARQLARKRTGRLSAGNRTRVRGGLGTVTNTVRYAPYQEYGTSVMRARPFMRPALAGAPIREFYEDHAARVARRI